MNKGLLIGGGVAAIGLGALYFLSKGGDAGLTGIGGMTYSPQGTQGQETGEPIDWSQILPSETVVFPQQPYVNPFEMFNLQLDNTKKNEPPEPFVNAAAAPEGLVTQREQTQVAGEVKKNLGTTFDLGRILLSVLSPVGFALGGVGKIVKEPVVNSLTEAIMSSKKETTTRGNGGGSMGGFGASGSAPTVTYHSSGSSGWNRAAAAAAGLTTSPYSSSSSSTKKESKTSSTGGSAFGGSSDSGYGGGGSGGR